MLYQVFELSSLGNLSFLRESINQRIGINTRDKSGGTALYWAAHSGHGGKLGFLFQFHNSTK